MRTLNRIVAGLAAVYFLIAGAMFVGAGFGLCDPPNPGALLTGIVFIATAMRSAATAAG